MAPSLTNASPTAPGARTRRPFQSSSVLGGLPLPMNSYCGRMVKKYGMAFHCAMSATSSGCFSIASAASALASRLTYGRKGSENTIQAGFLPGW